MKTTQKRLNCPAILVLHVKHGYEDRALHMERLSGNLNYPFTYIIDGDISDLNEERLLRYFTGSMLRKGSETSCAMKHILAYEYILRHNLDGALILEDDIHLYSTFTDVFNRCMQERKQRGLHSILISFEESSLMYMPRSHRRKGQLLYEAPRDRFGGCYYITAEAARLILDTIAENKCDRPIDLYHTRLIKEFRLQYYWSQAQFKTSVFLLSNN